MASIDRGIDLTSWSDDMRDLRDGYHGLVVWGLMTVATAVLLLIAANALPRLMAPSGSGADASVAHEGGSGRRTGDHRGDVAAHEVVHRRTAAAERYMVETRAAARFQQLAAQMAGAADPGRAVVDALRALAQR